MKTLKTLLLGTFIGFSSGIASSQIVPQGLNLQEHIRYDKKLSLKNLDEARLALWTAWGQANEKLEEQPLPDLQDLGSVTPHFWDMIGEDPMPFYWGRKGDSNAQDLPLFINIHGSGPKAHEWKANLYWVQKYEDGPSVYFVPQIPSEQRYRWWFQPEQLAWEKLFRLAFLDKQINPNKF